MRNYISNIFHVLIITVFILSFSGCGVKGDPVYVPNEQKGSLG